MDRNMRLTTIDLTAPKDNKEIVDAMFSIIISRRWAKDIDEAIDEALENGNFAMMNDDDDLEDFEE